MKILDVNVVIPAHREDHGDHAMVRPWFDGLLASREQFGVPLLVWWSFVRLASKPRVFAVPTPIEHCLAFIDAVRSQPGHVTVEPGARHLECLRDVCTGGEATGDLVPDAVLAALALEHGGTVVSFDRDFARFPGLAWTRPS